MDSSIKRYGLPKFQGFEALGKKEYDRSHMGGSNISVIVTSEHKRYWQLQHQSIRDIDDCRSEDWNF